MANSSVSSISNEAGSISISVGFAKRELTLNQRIWEDVDNLEDVQRRETEDEADEKM